MKNRIIVLLLLLIIPIQLTAKEVNDVSCAYHIECEDPINKGTVDLGYMKITYTGYNDGNYSNGSMVIGYGEDANTDYSRIMEPGTKYKDYKNYKFGDKKRNLYFMHGDNQGQNFMYRYKDTKDCPQLYCAVNNSDVYVVNVSNYTTGMDTSNKEMKSTESLLRNTTENKWLTKKEFYGDPTVEGSPKDPLVCEYEIEPEGSYYGTALNNTYQNEKAKVELKTNYDADTGKPYSYHISVNGYGPVSSFLSLDQRVEFEVSSDMATFPLIIKVKPEQLKKMFNETCPDKDSLHLYFSNEEFNQGRYVYILTMDANEAKKDKLCADYDSSVCNPNDGDSGDIDDFGFGDGDIPCQEILGPVLTKVVKIGITIIQIVAAIIAIVKGMMVLLPAVIAKDADALKKASKTLVILAVILALVIIFRPLVRIIGKLLDYDISCIL